MSRPGPDLREPVPDATLPEGEGRRAVVTGASGFIGTHLVHTLARAGWRVIGHDRHPPIEPLPTERFFLADLRDGYTLAEALWGADVVFHLAAIPAIARRSEADYRAINSEGTELVLRMARRGGARSVVHVSTSTVYGVPETCPIPEDHPLRPGCEYSRSKLEAERHCARHARQGLDVTILRPRVVVGPGRAGIFGLYFVLLDLGLPAPLPASGRTRFQFTHVADLCRACLLAADAHEGSGSLAIYNVGCDVPEPNGSDFRRLRDHMGSSTLFIPFPQGTGGPLLMALHPLGILPVVPEQIQILAVDFVLDTGRIDEALGFRPAHDNSQGLCDAWDWWSQRRGPAGVADLARWWRPRHQGLLQRRGEG